jgi:hypothetical protein
MSSHFSKIFLSLLLLCGVFSLKLQLVDEDYVIVQIGYPPKQYKLMVDPVGPFTYIFKENESTSKRDGELSKTEEFQNVFGNFSGVWKNDFFYLTSDKLMNFRMDYVEIKKKETKLICDGVLGLGYSFKHSFGNIYEVLEKMYNVFKSKKMISYDKKKMQITLGEFPERSNYNPTIYKIYEKNDYPGIFLQLEKIRFMTDYDQTKYLSSEDLKDDALITLLPVVIAPKHRLKNLYTNYTTLFNTSSSTYSKKGVNVNETKFYSDFYLTNPNKHMDFIELVFDRMAYKFRPFEKKGDGKYRPQIRFGNDLKYLFKYWIVGVDVIGVDRFDINFEENTIKFYSKPSYDITKSKPQLLRDVFVYMTIICIMLGFMFIVFCQKKKQNEIKPGEELIELN